jgi:hypothetical protein
MRRWFLQFFNAWLFIKVKVKVEIPKAVILDRENGFRNLPMIL